MSRPRFIPREHRYLRQCADCGSRGVWADRADRDDGCQAGLALCNVCVDQRADRGLRQCDDCHCWGTLRYYDDADATLCVCCVEDRIMDEGINHATHRVDPNAAGTP